MVDIVEKKPEDRLYDSCNVVENEKHFLCECIKYDTSRQKLFDSINDSDFVLGIDYKKTFITLMRSTDKKIIKAIANFVHDCQIT